jgi:hypothetical protein
MVNLNNVGMSRMITIYAGIQDIGNEPDKLWVILLVYVQSNHDPRGI